MKTLDWDKAARILKRAGVKSAAAGLREDWGWTADTVLARGRPVWGTRAFVWSTWATPCVLVNGKLIDCHKPGAHGCSWPPSAVAIFRQTRKAKVK